jgi:primary-amine oxidase
MYRAALAEIIVPYGDPRSPYQYKCAYDVADYGLVSAGCCLLLHLRVRFGSLHAGCGTPLSTLFAPLGNLPVRASAGG